MLQMRIDHGDADENGLHSSLTVLDELVEFSETFGGKIEELEHEFQVLKADRTNSTAFQPEEFLDTLLSDLRRLEQQNGDLREQLGRAEAELSLLTNRLEVFQDESVHLLRSLRGYQFATVLLIVLVAGVVGAGAMLLMSGIR